MAAEFEGEEEVQGTRQLNFIPSSRHSSILASRHFANPVGVFSSQ